MLYHLSRRRMYLVITNQLSVNSKLNRLSWLTKCNVRLKCAIVPENWLLALGFQFCPFIAVPRRLFVLNKMRECSTRLTTTGKSDRSFFKKI